MATMSYSTYELSLASIFNVFCICTDVMILNLESIS